MAQKSNKPPIGYDDTPMLPDSKWRVHDGTRPQPKVVAPRFEGEKLISPAYVTVFHNGVVVHHHQKLMGPTGHRILASYKPHPPKGPIRLQDHGDPVRYRNIWIRELKGYYEE